VPFLIGGIKVINHYGDEVLKVYDSSRWTVARP